MLKPGADVVEGAGGLHRFTGWDGPMLTDSGGFQVFSLKPKVDDNGVTFRSAYDGGTHRLTPESAVRIQEQLGADIQMVLDVCPPLPSPLSVVRSAVDRTAAWAQRAKDAHRRDDQALFGIVPGGVDEALRKESAERTVAIGFDGYAIGGLSVGERRDEMVPALRAATDLLPADRVRYLMGVGDPAGLVEAVAAGVDLFDCVLPTRHGRHGTVLTNAGRLNLRNAKFSSDDRPLDPDCGCRVCRRWSRAYLRHLLSVREPTGPRLVTVHNVAWTMQFVESMRAAVRSGRFAAFRQDTAAVWG
jgi:queuine tRNA-ribosyltransferase